MDELHARQSRYFIVGTYTDKSDESIFLFRIDADSGEMWCEQGHKAGEKTSWIQWDASKGLVFVLNESEKYGKDEKQGLIHSLRFQEGKFISVSQQPSGGGLPVSLLYLPDHSTVLSANYTSGTVAVIPVHDNGELAPARDIIQHVGKGPDKERQKSAHAHQVLLSPDKSFIYAVDLGIDRVRLYRFDNGTLMAGQEPVAYASHPGWGPRQMVFHPHLPVAYLIHEIRPMVSVLQFDQQTGTFKNLQDASCVPEDYTGENKCGAVQVHPSGKYLYISNRGHDSIVCYPVDEKTGKLGQAAFFSSGGKWPRHICLSPDGAFLISANQKSDSIHSYRIDMQNGSLQSTGHSFPIEKPVFAEFVF